MTLIAAILSAAAVALAAGALIRCGRTRHEHVPREEVELFLHQLKNPIQSILLHADLLQQPAADDAAVRAELSGAIAHEAERAAAMLGDFPRPPEPRGGVPARGARRAGSGGLNQ